MSFSIRNLALFALLGACLPPCPALADGWKAGTATRKITPTESMWMAGYGSRNHPSTGFLNDLWAKALVLEDAKSTRVAIITLDLVGIGPDVVDPVTAELESKYRLPRANVAVCCSHAHSGPVVGINLRTLHRDLVDETQKRLIDGYAANLRTTLVELVGRAIAELSPGELSYGQGTATFATNRRNNKEAEVPQLRTLGKLAGPFDHDVPVLAVAGASGKLTAVLFGYACHATVLDGYEWSSDYPGFAESELEKEHPGCTALFFAGCGADQNPLPRRKAELARQYGRELAAAVDAVLAREREPIAPILQIGWTQIPLQFAHVPKRDEVEKDSQSSDRYVAARAKLYLEWLDAGKEIPATYPYPVQVWRLGRELVFIALGGEVVVDYALRLKGEYGADRTWVAGYANDVMAYIPSRRVLAEGGYEGGGAMVYYSLPSPWAPTVEAKIIDAVRALMPFKH
ncbi:MAG: neutral/alkaline non-lysosomal ceramidase N-terminal domain-containing protein [Pirellulales bacterium]